MSGPGGAGASQRGLTPDCAIAPRVLSGVEHGAFANAALDCTPAIRTILRLGAYQFLFMNAVLAHAVCNEVARMARVLDLCTAIGGKTTPMAEPVDNQSYILAPDEQGWKLARLKQKYVRLQTES